MPDNLTSGGLQGMFISDLVLETQVTPPLEKVAAEHESLTGERPTEGLGADPYAKGDGVGLGDGVDGDHGVGAKVLVVDAEGDDSAFEGPENLGRGLDGHLDREGEGVGLGAVYVDDLAGDQLGVGDLDVAPIRSEDFGAEERDALDKVGLRAEVADVDAVADVKG